MACLAGVRTEASDERSDERQCIGIKCLEITGRYRCGGTLPQTNIAPFISGCRPIGSIYQISTRWAGYDRYNSWSDTGP